MIRQNIGLLLAVQAARLIVPIAVYPVLARKISSDDLAIYLYAVGVALWLGLVLEYGFSIYSTRAIAAATRRSIVSRIIRQTESAKLILVLISVPSIVVIRVIAPFDGGWSWATAVWTIAAATALAPQYYFLGRQSVKAFTYVELGAATTFIAAVLLLLEDAEDAQYLPLLWVAPRVLAVLVLRMAMRRDFTCPTAFHFRFKAGASAIRSAWKVSWLQLTITLYTSLNVVILGLVCTPSQVATFAASERVVRAVLGLIAPISSALLPYLSSLPQADSLNRDRIRLNVVALMGIFFSIAAVVINSVSPLISSLLFADKVHDFKLSLALMSPAIPAIAVSNILAFHYLIVDRRDALLNAVITTCSFAGLLLGYLAATKFGALGMAASWASIEIVIALALTVIVFRLRKDK